MSAPDKVLHVLLNDTPMGVLSRRQQGKLSFRYFDAYLRSADAIPLSLSMPLLDRDYGHDTLHTWLWGLLPDNDIVISRWARRFGVSASNVFSLLEHIGQDCAGAVRFIAPDAPDNPSLGGKKLLSLRDMERRLADLGGDPSLVRSADDLGQFSLGGAQSKIALQFSQGKWYVPWGREPTTHILKSARLDIAGHIENEHFCLTLAAKLGMLVAKSQVCRFGQESAIVIERYDRVPLGQSFLRVHQEDLCQALGVHPIQKYQSEGGPDILSIMALLNRSSQPVEDRRRFIEAIIFNYLILGTDAHAKNFSLLLGRNQQVRLARFYDIASFLPYAKRRNDARFAMKIGGHYLDGEITMRHFEKMAHSSEFPAQELRRILADMATRLPDAASDTLQDLSRQKVEHPILELLVKLLIARAKQVLRATNL